MAQKDQNLMEYCLQNGHGTLARLFRAFRSQKKISYNQFSRWCRGMCGTKDGESLAILSSITGIPQDKLFDDGK